MSYVFFLLQKTDGTHRGVARSVPPPGLFEEGGWKAERFRWMSCRENKSVPWRQTTLGWRSEASRWSSECMSSSVLGSNPVSWKKQWDSMTRFTKTNTFLCLFGRPPVLCCALLATQKKQIRLLWRRRICLKDFFFAGREDRPSCFVTSYFHGAFQIILIFSDNSPNFKWIFLFCDFFCFCDLMDLFFNFFPFSTSFQIIYLF